MECHFMLLVNKKGQSVANGFSYVLTGNEENG